MRWLIVLVAACSAGAPGPGVDLKNVFTHVTALTAIGPRTQDSAASKKAVAYIKGQLDLLEEDVRVQPVDEVEVPEITVLGVTYRKSHRVKTTDPNLAIRFGPAGDPLVIIAHYDTVAGSVGAIDNAIAVGVLIDLARIMHEKAPAHPVALLFTANEEVGLIGAEGFAGKHGKEISFAVALDLIGGSGELSLNGASTLIGKSEMQWLADAADRAGVIIRAPLAHRVISRWWPQAERSDHGAFTRRGIRAFHLYNRGNDGEWIDTAYHSSRDVPARADRDRVDELGRVLRALIDSPVPKHDGDGFWLPFAANIVIDRWIVIAIEIVLLLAVIALLVLGRNGLIVHITGDRVRQSGPGLLVGALCYLIAWVTTIGVERLGGAYTGSWLHDPLRAVIAEALVLVGMVGLATIAIRRLAPWLGDQRYLVCGTIVLAVIGTALLVLGAAEIAWIWLVPALALALAPRLRAAAPLAIAVTLLPLVLVLHPFQLREAAWNGFFPRSLPLAAWLGFLAIPLTLGLAWWLRRRRLAGPLGTLVLPVGCGLAILVGLVVAITADVPCTAAEFDSFHMACRRV